MKNWNKELEVEMDEEFWSKMKFSFSIVLWHRIYHTITTPIEEILDFIDCLLIARIQ